MKILFLDQSAQPGGAELCLLDIVQPYRDRCMVGLFGDGVFRTMLEEQQIPVQVLTTQEIAVRKQSGWLAGLTSLRVLLPLIATVVRWSLHYDLVYANTQKAFVVGAIASFFARRPLIYHLHDILSPHHFSWMNRQVLVFLANHCASQVIANSNASRDAFVEMGGRSQLVTVIYNGFEPQRYQRVEPEATMLKRQLGLGDRFLVGHFSRLAPWKGQHILIEALTHDPEADAIFVGDALFGEQEYVQQLQAQVRELGLQERVHFLGFRDDVAALMQSCNLVAHTSTAPEPFGRVIVEAMLCGKPVVASGTGGVVELIKSGVTGWLVPPNQPQRLATAIATCRTQPESTNIIAEQGKQHAIQKFHLNQVHQQIAGVFHQVDGSDGKSKSHYGLSSLGVRD
jgi:glycosyltransferase involved in cell wall biosynthesis